MAVFRVLGRVSLVKPVTLDPVLVSKIKVFSKNLVIIYRKYCNLIGYRTCYL